MSIVKYDKYNANVTAWSDEKTNNIQSGYTFPSNGLLGFTGRSYSDLGGYATEGAQIDLKIQSVGTVIWRFPSQGGNKRTIIKTTKYGTNNYNNQTFYREAISGDKGPFIETIEAEEGTYPEDGFHTDGYWYVKAFTNKYLFKDGEEIKKYGQSEWVKYTGNLEPDKSIPQWTKTSYQVSGLVAEDVLNIMDSSDGYCMYSRNNVVNPNDVVKLKAMVKVLSSSSEFTLSNSPPLMIIRDGAKALIVGLFATKIVEYKSKLSYDLDLSIYREIELIKNGATGWEIYVDGVKVLSGSLFDSTTVNDVAFNGGSSSGRGDSYWKYVHYSANDIANRSSGVVSIGQSSVTKEIFDIHGMTDLSLINDEAMQQFSSNQVELLCWTDEVTPSRQVGITGLPHHSLIANSNDIPLESAEKVTLAVNQATGAVIRIAVSSDDGVTWKGKSSLTLSDSISVESNGFTPEELNALTKEQLATLFPNGTARFAFYLEKENITDVVEIQSLAVGEKQYTISPTATDLSLIYEVLQEEKPTLYASRDDGVSWKEISQDEMASLSEQPEGNSLRVKAVLKNGQEIHAMSYAWA